MYKIESRHNPGHIRVKGRLQYGSKTYHNPFFSKSKKQSPLQRRFYISRNIKIIAAVCFLAIIGGLSYLFTAGYFSITDIVITGEGRVDQDAVRQIASAQLQEKIYWIIPQDNIFLFNRNKLSARLKDQYAFNSLDIEKRLPHTLSIAYNGKDYAFILEEGGGMYFTDNTGYVISEANLLEIGNKDYPIIQNNSNSRIMDNRSSLPAAVFDYVDKLFREFKTAFADIKIERFVIDNDFTTVKTKISSGPEIYFNVNADVANQIEKFTIIKNEKLKDDWANKTYIDVRFGDSVYYR